MAQQKPFLVSGIRGRNGSDTPMLVPDDQCCEALNVDFADGGMCRRRNGAVAPTFGGTGFSADVDALLRFLPGTDETAAQLFAFGDNTTEVKRLAGSASWANVTLIDAIQAEPLNINGVSLAGFLFVEYNSAVNRTHVWDGSTIRRRGLARGAVPTVATNGGVGLTFTRFYRVRFVRISGTDTQIRSEPSPAATISISNDASVRVTRPTAPGEGETHWEAEYADSAEGPWYVFASTVIATTFVDDAAATIDDTLTLSPEDGINMPPPSFKYVTRAGGRLLQAGAYETTPGESFIPLDNEVYWTPINGANDVGDLERQPINYRVSLDHSITGLSEALNGIHYAFGYRGISALVPTGKPGEEAFQRITERMDIGAIHQHTIVMGDDEDGNPAIYFLSHRGPYRITSHGMQYLGHDIEDVWTTVNRAASTIHGVYYGDRQQVWWWVPTGEAITPNRKLVFDTHLGRLSAVGVIGGWSIHTGVSATARCSVMFAETLGATMGYTLLPYIGPQANFTIWRLDRGTDDAANDFQAYIDTKEYAPAGLGRNCSLTEPYLIGAATATGSVTVTMRTDFGKQTSTSGSVSLAPEIAETHVQVKLDGMQTAGIGTVRYRIGDAAATDPGFVSLDALLAQFTPAEAR
jgi:hypothetical protein